MTFVDFDDRDPRGKSIRARHEVEPADDRRFVLLDDRGWGGSAGVEGCTAADVEATAKMVVGPDEPWGDQSLEQAVQAHWDHLERKLLDAGIDVRAGELRTLEHEVRMSPRLRTRV